MFDLDFVLADPIPYPLVVVADVAHAPLFPRVDTVGVSELEMTMMIVGRYHLRDWIEVSQV